MALFNDAVIFSQCVCVASNGRVISERRIVKTWEEVVVACFKALFLHRSTTALFKLVWLRMVGGCFCEHSNELSVN
jgi:hypothetical protein